MLLSGNEAYPRIAVMMGNTACRFVAVTGGEQAGTVAGSREAPSAAKTHEWYNLKKNLRQIRVIVQ